MSQSNRAQILSPALAGLNAYHVQDAAGLVKLDAMENPWPWPAEMQREWLSLLANAELNRYPDPAASALAMSIRRYDQAHADQPILLGNGSDELIQLLMMAMRRGASVLTVEPGFVMYRQLATVCGLNYEAVDLADDFSLPGDALIERIQAVQPELVFLAVPNNPTANCFNGADLCRVIEAAPGLVVIDEAYAPFTERSALPWLAQYPNLIVMRTLSKLGLAGLRLGYLYGDEFWVGELNKLRLPYNINCLTQVTAQFALDYADELATQAEKICDERAALRTSLAAISGLEIFETEANFILFRSNEHSAVQLHAGLRAAGVLVKCMHGSHRLLNDCLRVTVGTPQENQQFIDALQGLLIAA